MDILLKKQWRIKKSLCIYALANLGRSLDQYFMYYESCPIHIRQLLLSDVKGITTPHLILLSFLSFPGLGYE